MKLVQQLGEDPDPQVFVRRAVPAEEYPARMMSARFCPVCGGFSQWTPRLIEALYYECVPIILSDAMLPAFSDLLDWSTFSARLPSSQIHRLKPFARKLDHARLLQGVRRARDALFYRLGAYGGNDLLPLLLHSIARKVTGTIAHSKHRPTASAAPQQAQPIII